jgi:DNA polymerase III subunit alpha
LDEFREERSTLLASIDVALDYAELVKPNNESQLDFSFEEELLLKPEYVNIDPFKDEEKLRFEMEALGFYLSSHPVTAYEKYCKKENPKTIQYVKENSIGKRSQILALIGNERTIRTKKGDQMAFLMLSDPSGEVGATVFPDGYREFNRSLQVGNVLLFTGKADVRNGEVQFIVQSVKTIDELKRNEAINSKKLFVKISPEFENQETFSSLKNLFMQFHGDTDVVIYYEKTQNTLKLQKEYNVNPTIECLQKIQELIGAENVILKSF